jgi:hypothetical protein
MARLKVQKRFSPSALTSYMESDSILFQKILRIRLGKRRRK